MAIRGRLIPGGALSKSLRLSGAGSTRQLLGSQWLSLKKQLLITCGGDVTKDDRTLLKQCYAFLTVGTDFPMFPENIG